MAGVLVVAEYVDGELTESSRELVTAGAQAGLGPVTVAVLGADLEARSAATVVAGVDALVGVALPSDDFSPELHAAAVQAALEQVSPALVLAGYNIRAASYAPAVAARSDLGYVSDVVDFRHDAGALVVTRPMYAGKVHAEFDVSGVAFLLLRSGAWSAAEDGAQAPPLATVALDLPTPRVRHVRYESPEDGLDLKRADVIVAVGRGVGSQDNIAAFAELADKLGAMLGSSRPVVDAGWLPAAHQVGQTGVSVKPRIYVAFGISGALQHLAGMQGSQSVVAVNTDRSAPIFNVADLGAVADINEVAQQMLARL